MQNYFSTLGERVPLNSKTCDLISSTGIGFGVESLPIYNFDFDRLEYRELKGFKGIFKTKDPKKQVLGIVGNKYTLVHVREALEVFDPFIEEGFLEYEYAGVSTNGKNLGLKVWVLARLQADYQISTGDKLLPYILLSNSYDGTTSLSIRPTCIRMQCWNQYNMLLQEVKELKAIGEYPEIFTIKHTKTAHKRFIEGGKKWIESLLAGAKQTSEIYARMNEEQLEVQDIDFHLSETFDSYAQSLITGKLWKPSETIINLWSQGDKLVKPFSSLALYNSVTQWLTHSRGHNDNTRFYSTQWGNSAREMRRLFISLASSLDLN